MADHLIEIAELARMLGSTEAELRDIARDARLPFSFLTSRGLCVTQRDLPLWQHACRAMGAKSGRK